jgi:hypothetical protein
MIFRGDPERLDFPIKETDSANQSHQTEIILSITFANNKDINYSSVSQ